MTASTFVLDRSEDPSGVSGTGLVCEGVEFSDGSVAVRWHGKHPSTAVWGDIRDVEAIHGHKGKTVVRYTGSDRLLAAYRRVMPMILSDLRVPVTCAPHPDHPDRLRLTFRSPSLWHWWIERLDGSPDAAVHEELNGETEHRWVSPDGAIWLAYYTPRGVEDERPDENPLQRFHEEDR